MRQFTIDYLAMATAQARALGAHLLPLHDAHVVAYLSAVRCPHCGELFSPAQMMHGECVACWNEGLAQAREEEKGYASMVRRMW